MPFFQYPALSAKSLFRRSLQKTDLDLQGGTDLIVGQCTVTGGSHGGISYVAYDSSVNSSEGVRMSVVNLKFDDSSTIFDLSERKSDEICDRRRRAFSAYDSLKIFRNLIHLYMLP